MSAAPAPIRLPNTLSPLMSLHPHSPTLVPIHWFSSTPRKSTPFPCHPHPHPHALMQVYSSPTSIPTHPHAHIYTHFHPHHTNSLCFLVSQINTHTHPHMVTHTHPHTVTYTRHLRKLSRKVIFPAVGGYMVSGGEAARVPR